MTSPAIPTLAHQQTQAATLHRLHHHTARPLVLVNAWDAASARVLEEAGAPVTATTSAGMAWALGYADGEQVPRDEFLAACARICRVARRPVSIDIERGFADSTEGVCGLVRTLIQMGTVGINLEDGALPGLGLLAPQAAAERIAALRDLGTQMGVRLFINARTDTYFAGHGRNAAERFDEALQRARLFAAAGADGIFVPGMDQLDDLARLAHAIELPLNVYAGYPGVPAVAELAAAGVRRVSLGCGPMQSALHLLERIGTEALGHGNYPLMASGMANPAVLNGLFTPAHES